VGAKDRYQAEHIQSEQSVMRRPAEARGGQGVAKKHGKGVERKAKAEPGLETKPDERAGYEFGSEEARHVVFVLSVCDGIGAAFVAMDHYVSDVVGHACELEDNLREFVQSKWPRVTGCKRIQELKVENLKAKILAAKATAVLLIGGPPCQPFSGLGSNPRGFEEERSAPIKEFVRLRGEAKELCEELGLHLFWLMEEVASMSAKHRDQISELLGTQPVLMHAADFGHVHRARLYWGLDVELLGSKQCDLQKIEFFKPGDAAEGLHVVRWKGPSEPRSWQPDDGFVWAHRQEASKVACSPPGTRYAPAYPNGRFAALTTVFPHPADRPPKGHDDPNVYQRFLDDNRRRPLFHYVKGNMLWKDDEARPMNPEESEELMGFPRGYTATLRPVGGRSLHDARLSSIGNSFHVSCVVVLLALLFNPLAPAEAVPNESFLRTEVLSRAAADEWEERHAAGSVWDAKLQYPRQCDGGQLLQRARALFTPATFGADAETLMEDAATALDRVPFHSLSGFHEFLRRTRAPATATGPDIQALWCKSPMHAAVGKQHRPSTSSNAPATVIPRGVKPEGHVRMASELQHPFAQDAPLERDLLFAVEANVRLGPNVRRHRRRKLRVLEQIASATAGLDDYLRKRRPVALDNAPGAAPMFVAVMVILMRWPDEGLPQRLATGFELAGVIDPAGVFRPCDPKPVGHPIQFEPGTELLGPSAVHFVDELEATTKLVPEAQTIFDLTEEEVREGLAEPMQDRHGMDRRFGRGRWRPLPRHVIWQSGKWRPIDDGRRSFTNALTTVSESTVCIPPEFLLLLLRRLMSMFVDITGAVPIWAENFQFATEDWWKGFRQIAPRAQDRGLAVVALRDPVSGRHLYAALKGLPFGLGAAVNQFNRLPMLATALMRRMLYIMTGHYVDDNVMAEMTPLGADAQRSFIRVMELMGVKLSESKRQLMTCMAAFLGHIHDLSRMATDQAVCYGPKHSMRENLLALIREAYEADRLTSGAAAKMRGIATWLDTGLQGRCCRGALSALVARQYWELTTDITENLSLCMAYLAAAAAHALMRCIALRPVAKRPVLVYTDAADERGLAKLGGVIFRHGDKPQAMTFDVPQWLRESWGQQDTIINQAELVAVPILAMTMPDLLRDEDVIWFIDNTAAEAALVKAGSPTQTMCLLALRAEAILAGLGARVWYEHVPSADNPGDVLSRDALDDAEVKAKLDSGVWELREPVLPVLVGPVDFHSLWEAAGRAE